MEAGAFFYLRTGFLGGRAWDEHERPGLRTPRNITSGGRQSRPEAVRVIPRCKSKQSVPDGAKSKSRVAGCRQPYLASRKLPVPRHHLIQKSVIAAGLASGPVPQLLPACFPSSQRHFPKKLLVEAADNNELSGVHYTPIWVAGNQGLLQLFRNLTASRPRSMPVWLPQTDRSELQCQSYISP